MSEYDEVMKQLGRYSCNEHAEPVDDCIACEAWLDTLNAGVLLQKYHDALVRLGEIARQVDDGNPGDIPYTEDALMLSRHANKVLESEE